MNNSFSIHKDRSPEETIQTIREILTKIETTTYEGEWFNPSGNCYSVRVADMSCPAIGTNGKGVSESYALASGYAEFMERLQNGALYGKCYGLMPGYDSFHSDVVEARTATIFQQQKHIFDNLTKLEDKVIYDILGETVKTAPFYHINHKSVEYLPIEVLYCSLGTNGMCAGNTPEEAILQGLCEVLERFAKREIMLKDLEVPTIPFSVIKDCANFKVIEALISKGYSFLVKDCTLGGFVPVLGVIAFNQDRTKYRVAFGADPVFEVALQRAVIEAFQGGMEDVSVKFDLATDQSVDNSFTSIADQRVFELCKAITTGEGLVSNKFLCSTGEPQFEKAFQKTFKDHRDSLDYVSKSVQAKGCDLYIRDVSFLGFPSYFVYIPGMSECKGFLNEMHLSYYFRERVFIQKCMLDLNSADLEQLIGLFESLSAHPVLNHWFFFEGSLPQRLAMINLDSSNEWGKLFASIFLAVISHRIGDYPRAFEYLNAYVESGVDLEDLAEYTRCVLLYFKLRSEKYRDESIKNTLFSIFGSELAGEVIADVSNHENAFQYFTLPKCGDCSSCPVDNQCYYERWKRVMTHLKKKMEDNPIDQGKLSTLFE